MFSVLEDILLNFSKISEDAGVDGALAAMRRRDRDSNRLQSCRNTVI